MVNVQAPTVSQWAAVAALDGPQECVDEMREIYDARRRLLMGALDEMGFTYGEPRGGLYIWANTAATGIPALELSSLFLDEDVLIFPGTGFGENWGALRAHDPPAADRGAGGGRHADEARAGQAAIEGSGVTAPGIETVRVAPEDLRRQAEAILIAYGATPEEAAIQADARLQGELRGHPGQGQGMRGLSRYCEMLENGGIVPGAPFEVLVDTPALALVDGHKGFGQVIAVRAMDLAIAKARDVGVGLVGVRHSNHLGITAYHAMRAAEQRMIGLCLTNAGPEMAPWGGITPTIGTNPWGIAAPTDAWLPARPRHGAFHQRQGDDPLASAGREESSDRLGVRHRRQPDRRPGPRRCRGRSSRSAPSRARDSRS